jgi:hypothetical protein
LAGGRIETDSMGQHHTAELLADGQVRFQEEPYGSLSSAGVAVKEAIRGPDIPESVRATDGWSFWRATDAKAGDTVTLPVIRQRVATDHTARRGVSRSRDAREWLQSRASEPCLDPILKENPPPQQQFVVPGRPRVSLINGHSRSKESRAWPGTGMGSDMRRGLDAARRMRPGVPLHWTSAHNVKVWGRRGRRLPRRYCVDRLSEHAASPPGYDGQVVRRRQVSRTPGCHCPGAARLAQDLGQAPDRQLQPGGEEFKLLLGRQPLAGLDHLDGLQRQRCAVSTHAG